MKKIFQTLALLFSLATSCAFAQSSLIATLNHNGTISVFYGPDALSEAHNAATHGDAITLSGGGYIATDITKAITLRGAGMQADSTNNQRNTVIQGDFKIAIPDSTTQRLSIENIFNDNTITAVAGLQNTTFLKCRLGTVLLDSATTAGTTDNDSIKPKSITHSQGNCFIHCRITNGLKIYGNNDSHRNSAEFVNSYIKNVNTNYCALQFTNCIIENNNSVSSIYHNRYIDHSIFYNCIFIGCSSSGDNYDTLPSSCVAYNCLAINVYFSNQSSERHIFHNIKNTTNTVIAKINYGLAFKTHTSTYYDNENFELTETAKTKYLGNDGKEVGIYGGSFPYSPNPSSPRITKCNVATRSTSDGKLSVEIEVKSE